MLLFNRYGNPFIKNAKGVSIHPMLLFNPTIVPSSVRPVSFQYILCCYLTGRCARLESVRWVSIHPMLLFNTK